MSDNHSTKTAPVAQPKQSVAQALPVPKGRSAPVGTTSNTLGKGVVVYLSTDDDKRSRQPFAYTSLKVRNSCFVEAVRFYDDYNEKHRGGDKGWVRVLYWGNDSGPSQRVGTGHAVAICSNEDVLWMYDINYGFTSLLTPVKSRADITEVGPEVFGKFPQFKPKYITYRDDLMPLDLDDPPPLMQYLNNNSNADIRDATKVANKLGKYRIVRVIGFSYPDPVTGRMRVSAAAIFEFALRLCLYFPSRGTHLSQLNPNALDDLDGATEIIRQVYPDAVDISWRENADSWRKAQLAALSKPVKGPGPKTDKQSALPASNTSSASLRKTTSASVDTVGQTATP